MSTPCQQRPPGFTNSGNFNLPNVYPGQLIVRGNGNRIAITFTRSSIGGQIFIDKDSSNGGIITLNDAQPSQTLTMEQFGALIKGPFYGWGNGGGIQVSWVETLCFPC